MYYFGRLKVVQQANELCELIYKVTDKFPEQATSTLIVELRQAISAIPRQIAESSIRASQTNVIIYLKRALDAQTKTVELVRLSYRHNLFTRSIYSKLLTRLKEIRRLINRMIISLEKEKQQSETENKIFQDYGISQSITKF